MSWFSSHRTGCILHWVVQDTIQNFLVWARVIDIAIENFTYTVDTSGFVVIRPKVFLDMSHGVDAETINC